MPKRLNLRTFLVLSLLLGGVVLPYGYSSYQRWKAGEIEALEKHLDELWANEPVGPTYGISAEAAGSPNDREMWRITITMAIGTNHDKWNVERESLESRIEQLAGYRPTKSQSDEIETKQLTGRRLWELGVPTGVPGERVYMYRSRSDSP